MQMRPNVKGEHIQIIVCEGFSMEQSFLQLKG
jgi:hypothetical protein